MSMPVTFVRLSADGHNQPCQVEYSSVRQQKRMAIDERTATRATLVVAGLGLTSTTVCCRCCTYLSMGSRRQSVDPLADSFLPIATTTTAFTGSHTTSSHSLAAPTVTFVTQTTRHIHHSTTRFNTTAPSTSHPSVVAIISPLYCCFHTCHPQARSTRLPMDT